MGHHSDRIEHAARYFDDMGECIFCRILQDELQEQERVIAESPYFLAFIPYAALSPFHIWVFPKNHPEMLVEIEADALILESSD